MGTQLLAPPAPTPSSIPSLMDVASSPQPTIKVAVHNIIINNGTIQLLFRFATIALRLPLGPV